MMAEKIFFYFLLSHLIGDYVFQTGYIARYKVSKLSVLFLHSLIIFFSMFVVFLPSSLEIYNLFILMLLTVIHLFIDILKFKNRTKELFNSHTYYILDQVMHFSSLMFASFLYTQTDFFIEFEFAKIIAIGLFNAYFISLFFYIYNGSKSAYKRDYIGYILRFSLPLIKYYSNILFFVFSLIFILFSLYIQNKKIKNIKSELGPLTLSIIITYLSVWR